MVVCRKVSVLPLVCLALCLFPSLCSAQSTSYIPKHNSKCIGEQTSNANIYVHCMYGQKPPNKCMRTLTKSWKKLSRSRQGKPPVCPADYPTSTSIVNIVDACENAYFSENLCLELTDSFMELAYNRNTNACNDDKFRCHDGSLVHRDPNNNCKFHECAFHCPADVKHCPGGVTVGRDPHNNCKFKPCPQGFDCPGDKKYCPNGGYVGRDPYNNCQFKSCPEPLFCAADVRYCPGGKTVSRDPYNNCQFKPC